MMTEVTGVVSVKLKGDNWVKEIPADSFREDEETRELVIMKGDLVVSRFSLDDVKSWWTTS